jgi:hypothetical protein
MVHAFVAPLAITTPNSYALTAAVATPVAMAFAAIATDIAS